MQIQKLTKYARYIKEKANHELIENDFGFITYEVGQNSVHIHDLWVDPDYRRQGISRKLVSLVIEEGKKNGCEYLTSCVQLRTRDATKTLKAQIEFGFVVVGANENEIKLAKEI